MVSGVACYFQMPVVKCQIKGSSLDYSCLSACALITGATYENTGI